MLCRNTSLPTTARCRHGDMLYMELRGPSSPVKGTAEMSRVTEDEVDQALSKKDGKIHRPRDPHLCVGWEGRALQLLALP